jgi:predicted nucleic acid-binding protein
VSGARAPATGVLWDTMFASKLRLGRPEVLEAAREHRGTALEPLLAAPVVSEVLFGFRRRAPGGPDADWWEAQVLGGPRRFRFVAASREAVVLAARVRAAQPSSPARARRTEGRKDPERRLSWSRDIALAAIAATTGLPVATEKARDFAVIGSLIERIAPPLTLEVRGAVH